MAKMNIRQEIDNLQKQRDERQAIYDQLQDPDSDVGLTIRGQIADLDNAIADFEQQLETAEVKRQRARKRKNWEDERPLVDQVMDDNYMGYIIPEDRFIYCRDFGAGQSNVQFRELISSRVMRLMNKLCGQQIRGVDQQELIDYFEQRGRSYHSVTASFNTRRWDQSQIYNKMSVVRDHWLEPDYANAGDYDPKFDILIHSVAGGKEENIQHLEQWVAFKYLYPHKNANIPNIDMGGNPGGNGKGRFVEMLKTIFTPTCVVQAHREELDKFNANWEMAAILYYDEPEERELAAGKLKQATGAEDMRIEKKGIDATMADRNYNFIFLSNNERGVVRLSGGSDGGEDRRYSVITTDVVLFDLLTDAGYDDAGARSWLDALAQDLVKDPQAVSRWLAHVIVKHNVMTMTTLAALHGEDYHRRFDDQKDAVTEAFDLVLPVFQALGCMPQKVLADAVKLITENPNHKTKNISHKFSLYLTRKKISAQVRDRVHVPMLWLGEEQERLQARCFLSDQHESGSAAPFEWSTISTRKWLKGGWELNILMDDTLKIERDRP